MNQATKRGGIYAKIYETRDMRRIYSNRQQSFVVVHASDPEHCRLYHPRAIEAAGDTLEQVLAYIKREGLQVVGYHLRECTGRREFVEYEPADLLAICQGGNL